MLKNLDQETPSGAVTAGQVSPLSRSENQKIPWVLLSNSTIIVYCIDCLWCCLCFWSWCRELLEVWLNKNINGSLAFSRQELQEPLTLRKILFLRNLRFWTQKSSCKFLFIDCVFSTSSYFCNLVHAEDGGAVWEMAK